MAGAGGLGISITWSHRVRCRQVADFIASASPPTPARRPAGSRTPCRRRRGRPAPRPSPGTSASAAARAPPRPARPAGQDKVSRAVQAGRRARRGRRRHPLPRRPAPGSAPADSALTWDCSRFVRRVQAAAGAGERFHGGRGRRGRRPSASWRGLRARAHRTGLRWRHGEPPRRRRRGSVSPAPARRGAPPAHAARNRTRRVLADGDGSSPGASTHAIPARRRGGRNRFERRRRHGAAAARIELRRRSRAQGRSSRLHQPAPRESHAQGRHQRQRREHGHPQRSELQHGEGQPQRRGEGCHESTMARSSVTARP